MKFYIAYGSNLNIKKMKLRCPNAKPLIEINGIRIKILRGWQLNFNRYANITRKKNGCVPIGFYEITKICEKKLDIYEGYPFLYTKIYLNVNSVLAMTYVMKKNGIRKPSMKYFSEIETGYENFGLDKKYLKNYN